MIILTKPPNKIGLTKKHFYQQNNLFLKLNKRSSKELTLYFLYHKQQIKVVSSLDFFLLFLTEAAEYGNLINNYRNFEKLKAQPV